VLFRSEVVLDVRERAAVVGLLHERGHARARGVLVRNELAPRVGPDQLAGVGVDDLHAATLRVDDRLVGADLQERAGERPATFLGDVVPLALLQVAAQRTVRGAVGPDLDLDVAVVGDRVPQHLEVAAVGGVVDPDRALGVDRARQAERGGVGQYRQVAVLGVDDEDRDDEVAVQLLDIAALLAAGDLQRRRCGGDLRGRLVRVERDGGLPAGDGDVAALLGDRLPQRRVDLGRAVVGLGCDCGLTGGVRRRRPAGLLRGLLVVPAAPLGDVAGLLADRLFAAAGTRRT